MHPLWTITINRPGYIRIVQSIYFSNGSEENSREHRENLLSYGENDCIIMLVTVEPVLIPTHEVKKWKSAIKNSGNSLLTGI